MGFNKTLQHHAAPFQSQQPFGFKNHPNSITINHSKPITSQNSKLGKYVNDEKLC
jgi:hypothetical protein